MPATIRDVASAAGVSASTVSRAFSSPDVVSPVTRERVVAAARTLRYSPNRAARGLITGRTGNLGLVVPDLGNPFFPSLVKGVQTRAAASDLSVFLADSDEDPVAEADLVAALTRQVDGIVVCAPRSAPDALVAAAGDTPTVLVNRPINGLGSVLFDHEDGMRQVVAHLVALAHTRVAWVGGPPASWSGEARISALRRYTAAAGVELVDLGHTAPTHDGGVAAADLVAASGATAVVAYNDLVAAGILSRLATRGIAVPDALSVVGVDGIALAEMTTPPLTTLALSKRRAGQVAVDLLLRLLADPEATSGPPLVLPTQLKVRASTSVAHHPLNVPTGSTVNSTQHSTQPSTLTSIKER